MKESIERLRPTYSLEEDRLNALRQILPGAFEDGKINFETLRELLGDEVEDEGDDHFGLSWTGKKDARRLAGLPSKGTLVPVAGEGIDEDTTENIFIEGDNLEVLKLLHKSYRGRIKMIYIDPPYNTGNDFIYKDDYREPLESYLQRSEQISDAGELLTSNPKSSGRFHSNWLNMMYPRLRVAKDLLREDGVIFISIGDDEIHNLRQLMNEIFGEENFVNIVSVKAKPSAGASGGGEDKRLKKNVEYLLIYVQQKNSEVSSLNFDTAYDERNLLEHIREMRQENKSWKYTRAFVSLGEKTYYRSTKDGKGDEIKIYSHTNWEMKPLSELKPDNLSNDEAEEYVYKNYLNKIFRDTNAQSSIRARVAEACSDIEGLISIEYIPQSGRSKGKQTTVYYIGNNKDQIAWLSDISEIRDNQIIFKEKISTLWSNFNWNNVSREGEIPFPNGKKPIAFIQQMLELATSPEDDCIVLDFFGGSGSTGHAVLDLNQKDRGNRKFVIVQLPEKSVNIAYENIAELTKDRLKRSIKSLSGNPLLHDSINTDNGFKVFRLERSNFRAWTDFTGQELADFRPLLETAENPFIPGAVPEDILTEILLLEGFPLNSKVELDSRFERNQVYRVTSEFSEYHLFITLDKEVWEETIDHASELDKNDIFICLDNALSDESKVRLSDVCRLKTI